MHLNLTFSIPVERSLPKDKDSIDPNFPPVCETLATVFSLEPTASGPA